MCGIQALVGVAFAISITRGDLGPKEGAIAFAPTSLGIEAESGLLTKPLDGAVAFSVGMILGLARERPLFEAAEGNE
jgi:hypothetical protein